MPSEEADIPVVLESTGVMVQPSLSEPVRTDTKRHVVIF